ncbi:hypothetical protein KRZ98_18255 [Sphingobium sp. AS12]|uniref:hypothetical protein n=1 Tax=Sphingobium sp. AS12 TaxID=2849495 RepID=UPI001C31D6CF|nr:hypothetical protein [Sphingobium sp. AS12]MBV2150181.1 hypothetical protein [Sphingobium sp. AS12]
MAYTQLTDTIKAQPKVFAALVAEAATDLSKFRQSGIVSSSPYWDSRAVGEGFETTVRSWAPLYLGAEASSGDDSDNEIVARKVTAKNLIARRFHRVLAYAAADIVQDAIGADPLEYAAGQLARLWVDDEELMLLAMLKSIETVGAGQFVKSASRSTGTIDDTNKLNPKTMLSSKNALGDFGDNIRTWVIHSDVYTNLQMLEPNAFVPLSQTSVDIYRYLNKYNVIVTDRVGKDTTLPAYPVYTNYAFGDSVFGYGNGGGSAVVVRDELKGMGWGQETIVSRSTKILHPMGFDCKAVPANGVSLTNAEIAATGSFTLSAERKSVPLVIVKTNG